MSKPPLMECSLLLIISMPADARTKILLAISSQFDCCRKQGRSATLKGVLIRQPFAAPQKVIADGHAIPTVVPDEWSCIDEKLGILRIVPLSWHWLTENVLSHRFRSIATFFLQLGSQNCPEEASNINFNAYPSYESKLRYLHWKTRTWISWWRVAKCHTLTSG